MASASRRYKRDLPLTLDTVDHDDDDDEYQPSASSEGISSCEDEGISSCEDEDHDEISDRDLSTEEDDGNDDDSMLLAEDSHDDYPQLRPSGVSPVQWTNYFGTQLTPYPTSNDPA